MGESLKDKVIAITEESRRIYMNDYNVKDILGKQLQRLSDRAESAENNSKELCMLTASMVDIVNTQHSLAWHEPLRLAPDIRPDARLCKNEQEQ
jgi:hypothetical protein